MHVKEHNTVGVGGVCVSGCLNDLEALILPWSLSNMCSSKILNNTTLPNRSVSAVTVLYKK